MLSALLLYHAIPRNPKYLSKSPWFEGTKLFLPSKLSVSMQIRDNRYSRWTRLQHKKKLYVVPGHVRAPSNPLPGPLKWQVQLSRKNLRTGSSDTLPEHSASLHRLAGQGLPHTKAMSNFKTAIHAFF